MSFVALGRGVYPMNCERRFFEGRGRRPPLVFEWVAAIRDFGGVFDSAPTSLGEAYIWRIATKPHVTTLAVYH